jgi:hypothetical protein
LPNLLWPVQTWILTGQMTMAGKSTCERISS